MATPERRTIGSLFEYADFYPKLKALGDKLQVKDFTLTRYHFNSIRAILAWWIRDEDLAAALSIDLKKGLLIMGSPNIGKTTLMMLLQHISIVEKEKLHPFRMISCSHLSDQYAQEGRKALSALPATSHCYDGLGRELPTSYFSQRFELMQKVILDCADSFVRSGLITHVTTHLSGEQIENRYGSEVRSKMRFMFNQVVLNK